jgi:hypothetical protein
VGMSAAAIAVAAVAAPRITRDFKCMEKLLGRRRCR